MTTWLFVSLSVVAALLAPFSALAAMLLLTPALAVVVKGWPEQQRGLAWLMLGWLFWLPASLAFSQAPGLSLPQAAMLLCLPLAWLAGRELERRGQLGWLLEYGLPVLLLVLLAWGLLQGPNTVTQKPQGPFNDPNTYAALLNLLTLPLLARYLAADLALAPRWLRTGQLALLAGAALVAFLVSSRGAALAAVLVLPPLLWLARKQSNFGRKLALLASVALLAYLAALAVSGGLSVAQRLVDTVQGGDPLRLMLLRSAWLAIMDHPWLGTGLGTFRLLYAQYRFPDETGTAGGWVHNDYLQVWLEAGLPMLLMLLGLVLWLVWAIWRTLRPSKQEGGREALLRMGYLAGIGAILLHALVNFLFFFALVSVLVGLYLARAGQIDADSPVPMPASKHGEHARAVRLAAGGYAFLLGYLLLGQVAVEGLLGEARFIQRTLWQWHITYPRYDVAYWVSVLAPFHPTPQQIMGLELKEVALFDGDKHGAMRNDALDRMAAAWQRAPCYLPYANDALAVIRDAGDDALTDELRARGRAIAQRNLACNARHGLSYYHAGLLAGSDAEAMMWWRAGLAASLYLGDRLLLTTAILSRTTPGHEQTLAALAARMAQTLRGMEAKPGEHTDQAFWSEAQYTLLHIAGPQVLQLAKPPKP
jgi:O-antigen ligase